ncbi:hypothetical protein BP5796_06474 [Coleophoma crateriformis]|uniref:Uncharacterized protein n=1 Tax=Coleophoma crateriformis TaxID=565419 RepID=A0A3D8RNM9_9HELO|nr:hypothetical protein BP5796_06474 [Coleophoma crateriformis]
MPPAMYAALHPLSGPDPSYPTHPALSRKFVNRSSFVPASHRVVHPGFYVARSIGLGKIWVLDIEEQHRQEHQSRIKDVDIHLIAQQWPVLAHHVLDDTKDGTDHDEERGDVEDEEMPLPVDMGAESALGGIGVHAVMENGRDHDEESEEEELDTQSSRDDILSQVHLGLLLGLGEDATTA